MSFTRSPSPSARSPPPTTARLIALLALLLAAFTAAWLALISRAAGPAARVRDVVLLALLGLVLVLADRAFDTRRRPLRYPEEELVQLLVHQPTNNDDDDDDDSLGKEAHHVLYDTDDDDDDEGDDDEERHSLASPA